MGSRPSPSRLATSRRAAAGCRAARRARQAASGPLAAARPPVLHARHSHRELCPGLRPLRAPQTAGAQAGRPAGRRRHLRFFGRRLQARRQPGDRAAAAVAGVAAVAAVLLKRRVSVGGGRGLPRSCGGVAHTDSSLGRRTTCCAEADSDAGRRRCDAWRPCHPPPCSSAKRCCALSSHPQACRSDWAGGWSSRTGPTSVEAGSRSRGSGHRVCARQLRLRWAAAACAGGMGRLGWRVHWRHQRRIFGESASAGFHRWP